MQHCRKFCHGMASEMLMLKRLILRNSGGKAYKRLFLLDSQIVPWVEAPVCVFCINNLDIGLMMALSTYLSNLYYFYKAVNT